MSKAYGQTTIQAYYSDLEDKFDEVNQNYISTSEEISTLKSTVNNQDKEILNQITMMNQSSEIILSNTGEAKRYGQWKMSIYPKILFDEIYRDNGHTVSIIKDEFTPRETRYVNDSEIDRQNYGTDYIGYAFTILTTDDTVPEQWKTTLQYTGACTFYVNGVPYISNVEAGDRYITLNFKPNTQYVLEVVWNGNVEGYGFWFFFPFSDCQGVTLECNYYKVGTRHYNELNKTVELRQDLDGITSRVETVETDFETMQQDYTEFKQTDSEFKLEVRSNYATNDSVTQTVGTEIGLVKDQIDLKVSSDQIINSINLSTEGVTIDANKINLEGVVTASNLANGTTAIDGACISTGYIKSENYNGSNGSIDNTVGSILNIKNGRFNFGGGNLKYDGSKLTVNGRIKSTDGLIGGWTIGSNSLTSGKVGMSSSSDDYAFWAGRAGNSEVFKVTHDGTLRCVSVNIGEGKLTYEGTTGLIIEGQITATGGKIGGFDIGSVTLTSTDSSKVGICSDLSNPAFWAGRATTTTNGSTSTSYKFSVTHDGKVVAQDADIVSGKIGGWNLSTGNLSSVFDINESFTTNTSVSATKYSIAAIISSEIANVELSGYNYTEISPDVEDDDETNVETTIVQGSIIARRLFSLSALEKNNNNQYVTDGKDGTFSIGLTRGLTPDTEKDIVGVLHSDKGSSITIGNKITLNGDVEINGDVNFANYKPYRGRTYSNSKILTDDGQYFSKRSIITIASTQKSYMRWYDVEKFAVMRATFTIKPNEQWAAGSFIKVLRVNKTDIIPRYNQVVHVVGIPSGSNSTVMYAGYICGSISEPTDAGYIKIKRTTALAAGSSAFVTLSAMWIFS